LGISYSHAAVQIYVTSQQGKKILVESEFNDVFHWSTLMAKMYCHHLTCDLSPSRQARRFSNQEKI
jgi:hypothetical protein